jgi:retron-type reverse transcriptase
VKLLSDYLAEPWDPEHRNLDRVLEAEIKRLADEKEHRELVAKIRRLWNE